MFDKLQQATRVVPLEGGVNFRDLGGYETTDGRRVKWRRIFRCGHLGDLTEGDLAALAHLKVTQVHDFRRRDEQQRTPSQPLRALVNDDYEMYIGSMSTFWDYLRNEKLDAQSAHQLVVDSYRGCVDEVAPHYRRLFDSLLTNSDNATLFHCSAGKDRTGIAAALILSALGVSREEIIGDYLLTLECFNVEQLLQTVEDRLREAGVNHWKREWLIPYCSVHRDNIDAFFAGVDALYGSVDQYLQRAVGLTAERRRTLQAAYLAE